MKKVAAKKKTAKAVKKGIPASRGPKAGGAPLARLATILLVDDEDYIRELVGAILRIEGYEVLEANGPGEAIEEAADLAHYEGKIDLIICDAILSGGFAGSDVVAEVKARHPDAKAMLITGFPDVAYDAKGIHVLRKPFTPKTLKAEIENMLREVPRPARRK